VPYSQLRMLSPGKAQSPVSPLYNRGHVYRGPSPASPTPGIRAWECTPKSIVILGEALIDFMPCIEEGGRPALRPVCGGAPFNVALAIGRLGGGAALLANLSTDMFGDQICTKLVANGISLDYINRVDLPTTLAFVSTAGGEPQYAFFTKEAADRSLTKEELPALEHTAVQAMHLSLGAITVMDKPIATNLKIALIKEKERGMFTSFDPNLRPSMIPDAKAYLEELLEWISLFDFIKISDADLQFLYGPEVDVEGVAREWLEMGETADDTCQLVIVTKGAEGSVAFRKGMPALEVPNEAVEVVDTVGAGDSYMGSILLHFQQEGGFAKGALSKLDDCQLGEAMQFAAKVAGINCSRVGCDPPTMVEVK